MEFLKIVLFAVFAAIMYGILHDQVTAHLCVEYFTIAHPPVFHTQSPFLLALGWGVLATWWVGLPLGVALAVVSRVGSAPKLSLAQLRPWILKLLLSMAGCALVAGLMGALLVATGVVEVPGGWASAIPASKQIAFSADAWAHSASYISGIVGGIFVIGLAVRCRSQLARSVAATCEVPSRSPARQRVLSAGLKLLALIVGIPLLLIILLIVYFISYYTLSPIVLRAWNGRQMEVFRSELPVGLTRTEAYARIRARHMIAFNPSYDRWDKQPDGTYASESWRKESNGTRELVHDVQQWPTPTFEPPKIKIPRNMWYPDAWPNEAHPWAQIAFDMGSNSLFCSNTTYLRIDFDNNERISRVSEKPVHDCVYP